MRAADLHLSDYFARIRLQFTVGSLLPGIWLPIFAWPYANPSRLLFFSVVLAVLVAVQALASYGRLGPRRTDANGLPVLALPAVVASQTWTGGAVVVDYAASADIRFFLTNAVVLFAALAGTVFTLGPIKRLAQGALVGLLAPSAIVGTLHTHLLYGAAFLVFMGLVAFSVVPQISSWYGELIELRANAAAQADRDRRRAQTDELTSLPNRRGVSEQYHADGARFGSLLYVDLDRFKTVNDTGGHIVGDKVLIQVAKRLTNASPPGCVVGRIGGDEFLVLVPTAVDPDAVAAAITETMTAPIVVDGDQWCVGASIGAAPTGGGRSFETIVHDADVRMFAEKAAQRTLTRSASAAGPATPARG